MPAKSTASPSPVVLFDMDGVLVNSEPLHMEVERAIFRELGLDIPLEEHHRFIGMVPLKIWTLLRERYGLEEAPATLKQREQARKYELFRQREVPLVPGVRRLLSTFRKRGYPLALASSSPRQIIELFTGKTGTRAFFEFLLSGEEVAKGKPAPDIFLESARRLGADPAVCCVIEDSGNGVRAAKAAGMACIGFQNPSSGEQDLTPADLIVDSFEGENRRQIMDLIEEVARAGGKA